MDTHQGWIKKDGKGVKCSKCGDWIGKGEKAVFMQPAEINEKYKVDLTSIAVHGVIHKSCLKNL